MIYETPPSIRRIETDRSDACAFEITGHITAADVENLYGLLEAEYALHDKLDLLVLIHDYEGFDWSAAFTETTHASARPMRSSISANTPWSAGRTGCAA